MSGQQSNYVSRGANPTNNKWSLDGVDITDMAATGASPELLRLRRVPGNDDQHRRRGRHAADRRRRHQPGDQERHATRSSGSGRYYDTDDTFESNNITDDHARRRARPPATRSRTSRTTASRWAARSRRAARGCGAATASRTSTSASSTSTSRPRTCQAIKASRRARCDIKDVNDCLNPDTTLLQTTNLKGEVQLFKGNKLSLFNNFSKKERNARGASDLHPIETTHARRPRCRATFGTQLAGTPGRTRPTSSATSGSSATGCCVDVQYAHVGNNFILDFHEADAGRRAAGARSSRPA